jgi:hypothetical protein
MLDVGYAAPSSFSPFLLSSYICIICPEYLNFIVVFFSDSGDSSSWLLT